MRIKKRAISRREFVKGVGAVAAALTAASCHLVTPRRKMPPSGKLNIAFVGVGGRGRDNLRGLSDDDGVNVVALCDVDKGRLGQAAEKFSDAKTYRDFRKMLDEMDKSIDAVAVSTPDHTHAAAVLAAIRRGKHVYCEKPLAHSIYEIRELQKAAQKHRVITQLGNQGHSFETIRTFCEWIWDGAIGNVHTIHACCGAVNTGIRYLPLPKEKDAVPETLDWDLWLGPVQFRPYHPFYQPGRWRGWRPFGSGTIGDWVCHVVDPVFWALDLGAPTAIELIRAEGFDPIEHADVFPRGSVIRFEFPARRKRGPVTLFWYDGVEKMPRPKDLDAKRQVPDTGAIVLGDKGGITYGSHGAGGVRIFPEEKMKAYKRPEPKLPRVKNHHVDWLAAIRNNKPAGSNFNYGGPLTELTQLGMIAQMLPGKNLEWNGAKGRFTNNNEANKFLKPTFREGWGL
jgi:predicted dehydrogenase